MTGRRLAPRPPLSALACLLAVGVASLLVGCSPAVVPTRPPAPSTTAASPAPSATATSSSSSSPSPTASAAVGGAFDPTKLSIRLEPVVGGLSSPLAVVNAGDGSGRLFVVEQSGRIRIVRDGVLVDPPFLDIRRRILSGGERGLLGLAFAPDFPTDPRLFVNYTDLNGNTVVSSFSVPAATPDQADSRSERILLQIDQPFPNHNGGDVDFGPDGDLYIATGDGGSGGDPLGNGQSLTTLLGKLLRIRPGAADGSGPAYTIPPSNPFANDPSARPEIRAYGLRNPWRFSFDRVTGDLWIGDVGQDAWEEVDVIRATDPVATAPNFGWNVMEGRHCYGAASCSQDGLALPVAEYGHGLGCAIVGGYVGRDPDQPALNGGYLFADECSGNMWVVDAARPAAHDPVLVLKSGKPISSFGQDEAGRLYVTDLAAGELLRIVSTP